MNPAELRELRVRASIGQAPSCEDLVPLLEVLEDALVAAKISDTDDLVAQITTDDDAWKDLTGERDALTIERDTLLARVAALAPAPPPPWNPDPKVLRVAFGLANARPIRTVTDRNAAAHALYNRASIVDEDHAPHRQEEAIHLYREAIALDPALAIAHTNLGNCFFRQGKTADARAAYELARTLEPKQPEAHYNLGYLDMEAGELQSAADSFAMAVQIDPRFGDGYFNLANALELLGRLDDARAAWTRFLELDTSNGEWATLARSHLARLAPRPSLAAVTAPARARKSRRKIP